MHTVEALLDSVQVDVAVRQVMVGAFWTTVLLDTDPIRCGLASTMRSAAHTGRPEVAQAGHLLDLGGLELASFLRSGCPLEASIGMAALNALLEIDESRCRELNAEKVLLERATDRNVAIVGHFPFLEGVRRAAAQSWVLETHPGPEDVPASRAAELLPQADVVAITGSSLVNGTFDQLLALCRRDSYVLLLGPSTPLSSILFASGVSALSGVQVTDPEAVLRWVAQGAIFRQIKRLGGVRLLTLESEASRTPGRESISRSTAVASKGSPHHGSAHRSRSCLAAGRNVVQCQ